MNDFMRELDMLEDMFENGETTRFEYDCEFFEAPGNIRELRNVVERLMILGGNPVSAQDVRDYVYFG